jgi:hypothetical protein
MSSARYAVCLNRGNPPPPRPKVGTRPDKLLTCLTSLSRDTLLISTGNGPPGSTTVTSQGHMTSKDYAISSYSKVHVVRDTGLFHKPRLASRPKMPVRLLRAITTGSRCPSPRFVSEIARRFGLNVYLGLHSKSCLMDSILERTGQ